MARTDILGRPELTDRDLRIIAVALEIAYDGDEDALAITGFSGDEVDACAKRIALAIEDTKTW